MNNTISVIVPVYNCEKFLDKCLHSIMNQNFKDLEIILIDDGSTDGSGKICDEWAQKDLRIKVMHQNNSGVSTARNVGIRIATGEYILFVDADDTLTNDAIQIFSSYSDSNYDLVIGSYNEVRNRIKKAIIRKNDEYDQNKIKQNIDDFDKFISTPWAKLYRKSIITENNIRFNEKLPLGEDHVFNLEYCKYVNKCLIIDDIVYNYSLGGFASSIRYYENISELHMTLLKCYDNFGINKSIDVTFYKKKIKDQFLGSIMHYLFFCSYGKAKSKTQEAFNVFNDYLTENWIDSQYYSDIEVKAILNKQYTRLMNYLYRKNLFRIIYKKAKRFYVLRKKQK